MLVSSARLKAFSPAFDLASSLVESFFCTAPSSFDMETENTSNVLPDDLTQALTATLDLPTCHRLLDYFGLPDDVLSRVRTHLTAYNEQLETLSPDVKKQSQTALLQQIHDAFPKAVGVCLCPTRTGKGCTSLVSPLGGGLTCGRHIYEAHRMPDGTGPVRGPCQECKRQLDSEALACISCARGICTTCAAETTSHLPGEVQYSGVCTTCLAQNPTLSIFTYILSRETDEHLVVFLADHDEHDLSDQLESNLTMLAANEAVHPNTTVARSFPPVVTPSRKRRTPARPPPSERMEPVEGTGTAAAAAMAIQAPPANALTGTTATATTTQDRLDKLIQSTASGTTQVNLTVEELRQLQATALATGQQQLATQATIPKIDVNLAGTATAPPALTTSDSANAELIKALNALALRSQPAAAGASLISAGEQILAPSTSLQAIYNFLCEKGFFRDPEVATWLDVMGTGETKCKQTANQHLHGSSRADLNRATQLAPGNVGAVYDANGEQNLMQTRSSQRTLPAMHTMLQWLAQNLTLLGSLKTCGHGAFAPTHPKHPLALELVCVASGVVVFMRELLTNLLASGRSYEICYHILLFFHEKHLSNITLHQGAELYKRMLAIGSSDPLTQAATAQGVVLLTADYDNVRTAEEYVAAKNASKGRDTEGGPSKDKKKKLRPAPERSGACVLCGQADCEGYEAGAYLCTNEITIPCNRCGAMHARTGDRRTPCVTARNGGRGGRGSSS